MKKVILSLVAGTLAIAGSAYAGNESLAMQIALANVSPIANVINWRIGEFQDLNLSLQGMSLGTMHKEATKEEGNGIWLTQTMAGPMGNHVIEALLDRADGRVLKMRQDGKDTAVPEDKLEIIDQETATITVPAGTFETIHVRAKSQKSGNIELWANPKAITLDGTAKMNAEANGMPISMELTKFGGR
jgi:hypothetical protein